MKKLSETKLVTNEVRFSYAHVFTPKVQQDGGEAKFSASLIIPKADKVLLNAIAECVKAAAEAGKAKLGGRIPANLKTPLRDGDIDRADDPAYAGCMFINVSSSRKPGVIDINKDPILDIHDFYSGCYGLASINFYAFNVAGNKGIACGLENIMKTKDGERLSGGATALDDFSGIDVDPF